MNKKNIELVLKLSYLFISFIVLLNLIGFFQYEFFNSVIFIAFGIPTLIQAYLKRQEQDNLYKYFLIGGIFLILGGFFTGFHRMMG